MHSLWTSLGQRLGACTSRLVQATNGLLTPSSKFSSLAYQRLLSNGPNQLSSSSSSSTDFLSQFLHPSQSYPRLLAPIRSVATFEYIHRKGVYSKVRRKRRHPLEGNPQMRGVVLKTLVKKPKKPNSANRKCVRLRLTNGKEVTAYVPGEGHNLQEHNIVLVEGGRLQDTPGVKLVCIRGKYDLPHVKKRV